MNTPTWITLKQIEWANNKGLQLTGSAGERGRMAYTTTIDDNLFQPLKEKTRSEIVSGDGGELSGINGKPAKIQALHSSSALGVNVFDYWRGCCDLSVLTASCGLSMAGRQLNGDVRFEQQFSIEDRFQFSPNIDVVILPQDRQHEAFAIECKFTEAYSSHGHGGIDPKYFESAKGWQSLPETKLLAQKICPDDHHFTHLHGAQLIKHILGLNRTFGHARYRLLYLWYDALGKPGLQHREEIEEFAKVVRADGVIFHQRTYQDLIIRLARHRRDHPDYIAYLTGRYL